MRPLRIGALQWSVGVFCAAIGALMLVAPHQFASPTYNALRPYLTWCGMLFMLAGVMMLIAGVLSRRSLLTLVAHVLAGASLMLIAALFTSTRNWFGAVYYGVIGVGCVIAPILVRAELSARRGGDLLAVLMGVGAILNGFLIIAVPSQFDASVFGLIRPFLFSLGVWFAAVGLGLAYSHLAPREIRPLTWFSHVGLGVLLWLLALTVSLPVRIWTGVALYAGFGTLIAVQPWLGSRFTQLNRDSLRARLVLTLAVAAAVPMVLVVAADTAREEQAIIAEITAEERSIAEALADSVHNYVDLHRAPVLTLAQQVSTGSLDAASQRVLLGAMGEVYQDVVVFATYDQVGSGIARSDNGPLDSAAGSPELEDARRSGFSSIDVRHDSGLGRPVVVLAAPIPTADGAFGGIVVGRVDSARLTGQLLLVSAGFGGSAFIVDERGRMVTSPTSSRAVALEDLSALAPVAAVLAGDGSGAIRYAPSSGERFAGYARAPEIGWGVIVERPVASALAEVRAGREVAFGVLLLVIGLAALFGLAATGWVTSPLSALARAADRLAQGDNSAALPRTRISELAQLASAFGGMRARLADRSADLERAESTQRFLAEASRQLASSLDYDLTLRNVAQLAVPTLADIIFVDVVEDDGEVRRVEIVHVNPALAEVLDRLRAYPPDPGSEHGIASVLRTGQSILLPEAPESYFCTATRDEAHFSLTMRYEPRSVIHVPLVARDRTLGAITLVYTVDSDRRYTPHDLTLAEDLASRAALAVDNARLYREAQAAIRARDEFLSIASHELRTPVAGIKGYSQLMLRALSRGEVETARLSRSLSAIDHATDRLAALTHDLLDVSRMRLGQLPLRTREMDLGALVREVANRYTDGLAPRHQITLDLPRDECRTIADADRLDQVVTNLLDNAVKYSPHGGEICVALRAHDDEAILEVNDSGIGLPPEATSSIFSPFGRAPNAAAHNLPGMGLGLYICRNIVERHGGRIWAKSAGEGMGTTMTVALPAMAATPALELVDG